jgi:hypothetical protein
MGVTVTNLLQGPAEMFVGAFGALEPTAPGDELDPAIWRDLGGTNDGVAVAIETTWAELSVDQVLDIPHQTPTKRVATLKTNLAEPTLANWAVAQNAPEPVDGRFEPATDGSEFVTLYRSVLLRGAADSTGAPRLVIVRRAIQIDATESSYKKDGQTLLPVNFASHWVSRSVAPYAIIE